MVRKSRGNSHTYTHTRAHTWIKLTFYILQFTLFGRFAIQQKQAWCCPEQIALVRPSQTEIHFAGNPFVIAWCAVNDGELVPGGWLGTISSDLTDLFYWQEKKRKSEQWRMVVSLTHPVTTQAWWEHHRAWTSLHSNVPLKSQWKHLA